MKSNEEKNYPDDVIEQEKTEKTVESESQTKINHS